MASKSLVKASSSSSSSLPRWNYDVFLSFRGEDVRKNFVDHLYFALHQRGIHTFKDDERLERGKSIGPELLKSIEQSRFAVVVFSQNYGSSSWCLDELAKIIECRKLKGQTVLPFFYNVDPSEVRKQTGHFGEVFAKHDSDKVEIWKAALSEAASLSGWDLKNTADGHESKCIQQIVKEISSKLGDIVSSQVEGLVGMESCIEEVNSLLGTGSNDVRSVGIWGLSGIGKTTLARAIFDQIKYQFEAASFLHEVGEASKKHGREYVLEKLLSEILKEKDLKINNIFDGKGIMERRLCCKRVLLVLDDVDHLEQLEDLDGMHEWFGLGSRIIITTRDKQLLAGKVDAIYEAGVLDDDKAIQLFSWKAFKEIRPPIDFKDLSYQFIQYTGGLPLALIVLGSALYHKNMTQWRSALDRLIKQGPHSGIIEKLKIGFDGLEYSEKETFLDIACFFEGNEKDAIARILDSFDFYPEISLSVLIEKSLIYLLENRLCMHQLIREMGRHIVRQNFPGEPWKHSRLWLADDIVRVLKRSTGTENIEGIHLFLEPTDRDIGIEVFKPKYIDIGIEAFREMDKLRLLEIQNACVPQGPKYLPGGLRWIDWENFPLESMPPTFQADNLVGLKLRRSSIKQLWEGRKTLDKLKYINLSDSFHLIRTPDFTEAPNLETLILNNCYSLVEVHPSVGLLKRLVRLELRSSNIIQLWEGNKMLDKLKYIDLFGSTKLIRIPDFTETPNLVSLDLWGCTNFRILPKTIHLESLEVLNLGGCWKLQKFPEIPENMERLRKLDLSYTAIKELPLSIEHLPNLLVLNLDGCKNLERLPTTVCTLRLLEELDLSYCSKLEKLPDELGYLECLRKPRLSGTAITSLPSTICMLKCLEELNLSWCSKLEKLPEELGDLECLCKLIVDGTAIKELPSSIGRLNRLVLIDLTDCKYLTSLPSTICMLKRLEKLILTGCSELEQLPEELGNLECLSDLYLCGTAITQPPPSIGRLINLKILSFSGCGRKTFESRIRPRKRQCLMSLVLPSLSGLCNLRELDLSDCEMLDGAIPSDLGGSYNLVDLNLGGNNFVNIPSINGLSQLTTLTLTGCKMLQALPELPSSLVALYADDCLSLRGFSELSNKKLGLRKVSFKNCLQLLEDGQSNNISSIFWQRILQGDFPVTDDELSDGEDDELSSDGGDDELSDGGDYLRSIILPGKDILEWFSSNQTVGSSILVKLPPNWFNNKFRGFGVCAIFESITEATTRDEGYGLQFDAVTPSSSSTCEFSWDWETSFEMDQLKIIGSQHVCLALVPIDYWNRHEYNSNNPNDLCDVEFSIETEELGVVVKKLGICPVYDDMKPNDVM